MNPLRRVIMPIAAYMAQFGANEVAVIPQLSVVARNVNGVPMIDYLTLGEPPADAELVASMVDGTVRLEKGEAAAYLAVPCRFGKWELSEKGS